MLRRHAPRQGPGPGSDTGHWAQGSRAPDPFSGGDSASPPELGLHRAASAGHVALVLYALEHGQSPNDVLHGITPLHVAACMGHATCCQLLISFGADLNLGKLKSRAQGPGVDGSTALHFAAANGHLDVVRLLLAHGAQVRPYDRDGHTPESLAMLQQHHDCAALLRQWPEQPALSSTRTSQEPAPWASPFSSTHTTEGPRPGAKAPAPSLSTDSLKKDVLSGAPSSVSGADARRRTSIPGLIEKASHPAVSLRAALFSSSGAVPSTPSNSRTPDEAAIRSVRIPSRASITSLFRRTGHPAEDAASDGDARGSPRLQSTESSRGRPHSKNGGAGASASFAPLRSAMGSPPAKRWSIAPVKASPEHMRATCNSGDSGRTGRLRSHSTTSTELSTDVPLPRQVTRARASSEAGQAPFLEGAWRTATPPLLRMPGAMPVWGDHSRSSSRAASPASALSPIVTVPATFGVYPPAPPVLARRSPLGGLGPTLEPASHTGAAPPLGAVAADAPPSPMALLGAPAPCTEARAEARAEASVPAPLPRPPAWLLERTFSSPPSAADDGSSHSALALYLAQVGSTLDHDTSSKSPTEDGRPYTVQRGLLSDMETTQPEPITPACFATDQTGSPSGARPPSTGTQTSLCHSPAAPQCPCPAPPHRPGSTCP